MNNIGILDPEGKNNNPFTNKPYSDKYKQLAKSWSALPTYSKRDEVLELLKTKRVILIKSDTGSGKSVLFPKLVSHYYNYKEKIAMTLPKQLVAQSAAEYAAATLDVELGKEVGYKYKGSPNNANSDSTMILYATDGTIVNKLLNDPKLMEYKCIIIDEAHERKVQIDFLLYLLRNTLSLREDFKLVIMSATINESIFKSYFDRYNFAMLDISGQRNYEVESVYTTKSVDEYALKSYMLILDIVKSKRPGDILVFVTSVKETEDLCKRINSNTELSSLLCVELFSGLTDEQQELAKSKELYKKSAGKTRKVVIATEVAESSITIDGIIFVIDCGKALQGGYDPVKRARLLNKNFITQSQIKQRKGRAGRTEPGTCYHLYTEAEYKKLIEYPEPAIRKNNIADECLKLLNIPQIETTKNLVNTLTEFIEPPSENFIVSALLQLFEVGAVDNEKITKYGKLLTEIRADLPIAVAMIEAWKQGCMREVCKIAALYTASKGLFSAIFVSAGDADKENLKLKAKIDESKRKYASRDGDFISLYKIFSEAEKVDKKGLNNWCRENYIKYKTIEHALHDYHKLKSNIMKVGTMYKLPNESDKTQSVKHRVLLSIQKGFIANTGKLVGNDTYKIAFSKETVKIGQESLVNYSKKKPKEIFYGEHSIIMGTEKLNMISKKA